MSTQPQPYVPFNEEAALAELERLQRALEESRQKRKDASAAFDQFVNSFRKEPGREARQEFTAWSRTDVGPSTIVRESRIAPPVPSAPTRKRIPSAGIFIGALIATVAAVSVARMWRGDSAEPAEPATSAAVANSVPANTEPGTTPVSESSPSALPIGTQSELRALRHVWVRATVDGKRIVERELDAGDRVALNGRTIVVRAGDAGALRVIIDGQDRGLVGETGIAVTRTYTSSGVNR